MSERVRLLRSLLLLSVSFTVVGEASADEPKGTKENLGYVEKVVVTGKRAESADQPGATSVLTSDDLDRRDVARLSDALTLLPGVSFQPGNRGGGRNESSVYVRGFDLSRVPVLLDGIPIYVPYDGYIDLNRLQTFDLAAIEVARGYASVLYGPNAMAGAINLVTRRPDLGYAARFQARMELTDDLEKNGHRVTALGSYGEQEWYLQGGVGWLDTDFSTLPDEFAGGLFQPKGDRRRSATEDLNANVKLAWTPGNDEYALSYLRQNGEKGAPPYAENVANRAIFFDWPYYDKESLYLNTKTEFSNGWSLKGRLFYDAFQNQLKRFDNSNYTTQFLPFAFTSNYDDDTYGGSAELSVPVGEDSNLRVAGFLKQDTHREGRPAGPISSMRDLTGSLASALRVPVADGTTLTAGFSYDFRNALDADNPTLGGGAQFAVEDQAAFNWQAGIEHALDERIEAYAGISSKARFATMFERYSYRLGFGQPNPGLEPERLLTVEGGVRGALMPWLTGSVGAFWGQADDYIQSVTIGNNPLPPFNAITQFQNVGEVRVSGVEMDLAAEIDWFSARLAYAYLDRELTNRPGVFLFGTPENKLDADVQAELGSGLFVQGSLAYRDGTLTTDVGSGNPIKSYTIAGLKAGWRLEERVALEVSAQNIFDELYEYDDGYPGAGRSYALTLRTQY